MLLTWIREVADEPLLLDPTMRDAEARENTWSLSTSVDERGSLSTREVIAAFEECVSVLRERIRSLGYEGSATFYVWYDEQTGQLRCSTTTLRRDQLPFGARVELDVPLAMIVAKFLEDVSPSQVSWEDLKDRSDSESQEQQEQDYVLPVWAAEVGGAQ